MKQTSSNTAGEADDGLTVVFRNGVLLGAARESFADIRKKRAAAGLPVFALTEPSPRGSDLVLNPVGLDLKPVWAAYNVDSGDAVIFKSPLTRALETANSILAGEQSCRDGESAAQACRDGISEGFTAMKPLQLKRGFAYVM